MKLERCYGTVEHSTCTVTKNGQDHNNGIMNGIHESNIRHNYFDPFIFIAFSFFSKYHLHFLKIATGIFEVPLENIEEGNAMYTLIKKSPSRVEAYKAAIVANPQINMPILPVMNIDDDWDPEKPDSSRYVLLAGCNLLAALLDLKGDEK